MALSGHKSVQSLSIYQRVDKKEKLSMGDTLFQGMRRGENNALTAGPSHQQVCEIMLPPEQAQPTITFPGYDPLENTSEMPSEQALVPVQTYPEQPNFDPAFDFQFDEGSLNSLKMLKRKQPKPTTNQS